MQKSLQYLQLSLSELYPDSEIRSFWLLILEYLTEYSRTDIITNKNSVLSAEQNEKLKTIVERLQNFEPIQYILGDTDFFGLPFFVNRNVLIPRPETEELVDWILKENPNFTGKILDIGTGSGCIAIALAKNLPDAKVTAIDISEEAIAVAKKNADLNKVVVDFQQMDVLSSEFINYTESFDIIVSNPPYVCEKEQTTIQANVLKYEPHLALFVKDSDPLIFYHHIANFANKNLVSNGKLFFEINQAFGNETLKLLKEIGFIDVCLRKDLSGKDRMIAALKE